MWMVAGRRLAPVALFLLSCATVRPGHVDAPACPAATAPGGRARLTDFASPGAGDYAPAFRCAMAALCPDRAADGCGGVIEVPKGVFPVASTVLVDRPIRIVGLGAASQLIWSGSKEGALLQFDASAAQTAEDLLLTVPEQAGARACSASTDTKGTGILVQGTGRGPLLKNLSLCGFDVGLKAIGTTDGLIDASWFSHNRTQIELDRTEGWIAQALLLDSAATGLVVRHSAGFRGLGGRATKTSAVGVELTGCVGCSFDGWRFEGNAVDARLCGEATDLLRGVSFTHVDGVARIEVANPPGTCPVDHVAFSGVGGTNGTPGVVTVDSACPIRLTLDQAELEIVRRNSFDGSGLHDVVTYEANGFAPSSGVQPGGIQLGPEASRVAVVDREARRQESSRAFVVTSEGRARLGEAHGPAALSVTSDDAAALELVNPAGVHRTQDELPPRSTSNSVALRFLDASLRPAAEIRSEMSSEVSPRASLVLRTGPKTGGLVDALTIAGSGRVGIGTKAPREGLDVAGDVNVQGTLSGTSITVPVGAATDACRTTGQLQLVALPGKGSDSLRICNEGVWQAVSLGAP